MGAHAAGEMASALAVEHVPLAYEKTATRSPPLALKLSIEQANAEIHSRGENAFDMKGMGTTCTALAVVPRGALVGHVGDSRAYRLRGTTLDQLTRDHSAVWELESQGGLTREQAERTVGKNVITRSMGPHARVEVDIEGPHPVEQGDVFLLCSDGLSGQVADEEIGLFLKELPPRDACAALVGLTLVRGAPDNVTVIVAEARTNKVFKVFSAQPFSTLGKEQLKAVVHEFDIHAYDELQWANGVNRATRAVNTFQYFTGRPTKLKEPKRL
jgi:protein phosphatase